MAKLLLYIVCLVACCTFSACALVRPAADGYWEPQRFAKDIGTHVVFLGPFDPTKVPVLFVHGAAGSPQDWRHFLTAIDRTRFQPWVFLYPSGARLDGVSDAFYQQLIDLQLAYRFRKICITAHSMGGLVVRNALVGHVSDPPFATLFVSISTPWGGDALAETGVRMSPVVVPSWHDLAPGGEFLESMFMHRLPEEVEHHLFFSYRGSFGILRPNNDGTITLASQLTSPAQDQARSVVGFDEDHVGILRAPEVMKRYAALLDNWVASAPETFTESPPASPSQQNGSMAMLP